MINLIKTELKKIIRKKSFLIVTIIFILYALLTNILYKNMNMLTLPLDETDTMILEKENATLDLTNEEDKLTYVNNLTTIETTKLKETYNKDSQNYLIDEYLSHIIYDIKLAELNNISNEEITSLKTKLDTYLTKIKNNDWSYFTNLNLTNLKDTLKETSDQFTKDKLNILIEIENYRLKNNISYDSNDYLNNALLDASENYVEYYNLKNKETLTKGEQERYDYLKEEMALNKYIIEHQENIKDDETLRAVLTNFASEFGLFILIYVIMICGSIVSEEFNKGTIKYLLTKPYKRSTILTSKLLTICLLIPLILLMMVLIEIIIGGLILGFNSLSIPVLIYNGSKLLNYHVLKYLLLSLLSTLPMYLVLGCICFMLSTITTSTSAAITVTFLFYLMGNVISNLALVYNLKIFKYFISLHWDFSYLVNHTANPYHVEWTTSSLIVLLYLIVILCLTYVIFNKKDVKNI